MGSDMTQRAYHHGDVRAVVLAEVLGEIAAVGASSVSLRKVASRAGVAHTSVTHHFGNKAGLLAAVAADGFRVLAIALQRVREQRGSFLDLGVAYATFAANHPQHFEVMFRPDLYDQTNAALIDARRRVNDSLYGGADAFSENDGDHTVAIAGWALVHGLATLWLDGSLPDDLGDDLETVTRRVAVHLSPPTKPRRRHRQRKSR